MKQLMNALKTVQTVQWLAVAAAVCVLLMLGMGSGGKQETVSTAEEIRMERILRGIEGVKSVSVMISYNEQQEKSGVVVAASGQDDIRTMLELQRAVQTLTGLDLNHIEIVISKR